MNGARLRRQVLHSGMRSLWEDLQGVGAERNEMRGSYALKRSLPQYGR